MTAVDLRLGECLDVLRTLADNSIDAIVTDPPYGLGKEPDALAMLADWLKTGHHRVKGSGFMGKAWDAFVPQPDVWRECLRVLKPGGHLLAFAGTRTQDLVALGLRIAGFEIRDTIAWLYGSGFPKSHNLDGERAGWGTALKPALEPITVARKPLEGTVAANVQQFGTGALNIDGCRVGTEGSRTNASRPNVLRVGVSSGMTQGTETVVRDAGRWPANLIHDGSEEVVGLFPANAGASAPVRGTEDSAASVGRITGQRERVAGTFHSDSGSAARFFYCAKASRADRNAGCASLDKRPLHWSSGDANPGSFQSEGTDKSAQNHHPTVKPTDLMRWLCRLVTPPGGTVLDPFMGSGSTGRGAALEGFGFIGIEREPDYLTIAELRVADAVQQAESARREAEDAARQAPLFGAVEA